METRHEATGQRRGGLGVGLGLGIGLELGVQICRVRVGGRESVAGFPVE